MAEGFYFPPLYRLLEQPPQGWAQVKGSAQHPDVLGRVRFYQTAYGVVVIAEFTGLPVAEKACAEPIFAFHIHEGFSCTGDASDPFADVGAHYNPQGCEHPYHAGDLVPLFGARGYAYAVFLTDRFTVREVIGKAVILHRGRDDFTTQPSKNAGEKMACGEIFGRERSGVSRGGNERKKKKF